MFFTTALLALSAIASAQKVLFEGSGYRATVYYGVNDGDVCGAANGGPFPSRWADTSGINDGYPKCTSNLQSEAKTLRQYNSNRIVAMNANMVANDVEYWCGKEVQIFGPDGKQIVLDEGPFVLMDGCAACTTASIIDVSALAFTQLSGGKCGNNPEGFSVKVIDNDLSATLGDAPRGSAKGASVYNPAGGNDAPAPQQPSSSSTPAPASSPTLATSPAPVAEPAPASSPASSAESVSVSSAEANKPNHSTPAAQDTPVGGNLAVVSPAAEQPSSSPSPSAAPIPVGDVAKAAPAPVPDTCKYGKWRCDGLSLQICNRQTQGNAWETIASCAAECSFSVSGSAICQ
ncbi:hypothetical protein CcaverHIS002_0510180 [Cutaneotrichosporon cavernicola]|uniref:Uncharacterized protein n=1 Tax=Cutaneotrichosporon cavernicola TaxID=279322 RepID=A0AA48L7Q8_9TREE|nr:uncharacterized protein CcaverHIS019_0510740 [Cutaneotrichosporon cavernicola]BEI85617.1 hypothetical protein CcaverHIS002_0510180 [Cutaneotrichosporon cavernicola]BEI93446.1 hypothetical protein CcaverHIS019_0510740 [Cutaneotrichosporon cavernicola]BEJ01224.1 hypothetical protein CcaverHIS631_0510810 [Cutaneotrichosporon cavernicola]BEJ08993.1 hypothetical protein CcaverHIS641_0510870 [Cutaneotrichosporon cavernicola]